MSSPSHIRIGTEENFKIGGSDLELRCQPENLPDGKSFSGAAATGQGHVHKVTTCAALFRIAGRPGVGRTAMISELLKALPPMLELDDGSSEPEVRS